MTLRCAHAIAASRRKSEFAATPPPIKQEGEACSSSASDKLRMICATTTLRNDAAKSADFLACLGSLAASASAVLIPLKEKSPLSSLVFGSAIAAASPVSASASSFAPPGYPSSNMDAALSNASPAASSIVAPINCASSGERIRNRLVCPPDATSPIAGHSSAT